MKRVLFVATVTKHINLFHIPYLKWFKEQGYEVHVASRGNEEINYCDKHFNLPFERFPLKINNIKTYNELKKIIKNNHYDIIHCHTPVGGVLSRLAARKERKSGTKVLYTAHGFHFYKGAPLLNWLVYYPIEKIMAHYTDCIITIVNEDYEFVNKHLKAKKVEHINGIGMNTERFSKEITQKQKSELKNELKISKDNIVLTYVAELNKNKNQLLLIEMMDELKKYIKDIKLLLVGDGIYIKKYKNEVKKRNLQKNIIFLGKRKDIPEILSITDIYVASSIREGLPLNIMEAMYMNLPVVAYDNRGHRELVENKVNGYIVTSKKDLVEKVKILISDKNLRYDFGKKSKEKSSNYKSEKIIKQMEKIYMKYDN